jgi:hypothetical protein
VKYTSEWPYGVRYDAESKSTVVFNRRHEGICRLVGRWPEVGVSSAEPCDREPRQYGAGNTYFHRDETSPKTRAMLRKILQDIPVLREQVARRQAEKEAAQIEQSHAELVAATFGEAVT